MRNALLVVLCLVGSAVVAAPPAMTGLPESLQARQQAKLDLEYRLYDNVDFAIQSRRLTTEIKLAEERLKSLEKLQKEYESLFKYTAQGFTLTLEDLRLSLLEARLRLADMREEKSLLEKYRDDQRQLMQLRK